MYIHIYTFIFICIYIHIYLYTKAIIWPRVHVKCVKTWTCICPAREQKLTIEGVQGHLAH